MPLRLRLPECDHSPTRLQLPFVPIDLHLIKHIHYGSPIRRPSYAKTIHPDLSLLGGRSHRKARKVALVVFALEYGQAPRQQNGDRVRHPKGRHLPQLLLL